MKQEYDFAIVGGGLVGMAIAYGLTKRGQKTIVLDGDDQAIHYWPIAWDHATPKVTPGDPTALPSLLLGLSNADAGVRLASASGHALEACGGGPRR